MKIVFNGTIIGTDMGNGNSFYNKTFYGCEKMIPAKFANIGAYSVKLPTETEETENANI